MGCLQEAAAGGKMNLLFMLNTEVNIDNQSKFHCVNHTGRPGKYLQENNSICTVHLCDHWLLLGY